MSRFKVTYYEPGDVLYTCIDKPEEAGLGSTDDGAGMLFRVSKTTGKPCGVTVLDFKHTYGFIGGDELCFNIQDFLKEVPLKEVQDAIYPLLGYKR